MAAWEQKHHPSVVAPVVEYEVEEVDATPVIDEAPEETKTVEAIPVVEEKTEVVETPAVPSEPEASEVPQTPSTTSEIKEQPIEHVEIRNKPRISLEELEEALTQKKGPSETRSYRKRFDRSKFEKENKTEEPSKASTATAMPIYTEEELRALEEQEIDGGQSDYDNYDEELDEQYDYYDDDEGMKRN